MEDVLHNAVMCRYGSCERSEKLVRGYCKKHYNQLLKEGAAELLPRLTAKKGQPLAFLKEHVTHHGEDCLIWPFSKYHNGYGAIQHEGVQTFAHRVICRLAHGEPECEDFEASHTCENGHIGCVNPRHLVWETHYDNHQRRKASGRFNGRVGFSHPRAKVTPEIIRAVRGDCRTQKIIAQEHGISSHTVWAIKTGHRWAEVT